jgi:hypothetical protein
MYQTACGRHALRQTFTPGFECNTLLPEAIEEESKTLV